MIPLEPARVEAWCRTLAARCRCHAIVQDGAPYLDRYYVSTTPDKREALFLHHFRASDRADLHSHPWAWSLSLILIGGYRESRCTPSGALAVREFHPGEVNSIRADDRHRIDLLEGDCWTLFLAGPYVQPWTFVPSCEGAGGPGGA